jgi:hypothetical protein
MSYKVCLKVFKILVIIELQVVANITFQTLGCQKYIW